MLRKTILSLTSAAVVTLAAMFSMAAPNHIVLWPGATDLGGGWVRVDWFGDFATNSTPWIYHAQHHWLYPFGTDTSSIWFWDDDMGAFWWTSASTYPYLYRGSDSTWLWYAAGTSNPRWFYNFTAGNWQTAQGANVGTPTAVTGAAGNISSNAATINGTVNPNWLITPVYFRTSAYFQWGTTTNYGAATASQFIDNGTNDVAVVADLTGLSPAATFHFRLVATNDYGTSTGADQAFTTASGPVLTGARTYGGTGYDNASALAPTADGGYIVAGWTESFGAGHGDVNLWVLKFNSDNSNTWQKAYGGAANDFGYTVTPTTDGGYFVAGLTQSFGAGGSDIWVLKLNADGSVGWQKTYGGSRDDSPASVAATTDGGCIIVGWTESFGAGGKDAWVLKLKADGSVDWQNTHGGAGDDYAYSVAVTADGGCIVAGITDLFDAWVLKLKADGSVDWQKTYGGAGYDYAYSVAPTADGGYVVAGNTSSFGWGSFDTWVLKLDGHGEVVWQNAYGYTSDESAVTVAPTPDEGYLVAGNTVSFGAGNYDVWVLKLHGDGSVAWQKTYGGGHADYASAVAPTVDGGVLVAGSTGSVGSGYENAWVLKLNNDGSIAFNPSSGAYTLDTSALVTTNTTVVTGVWTNSVSSTSVTGVVSHATVTNTTCSVTQQAP